MKKTYYAVKKGRKTGIYTRWEDCNKQVKGFSGSLFKKFYDEKKAINFLNAKQKRLYSRKNSHKSKNALHIAQMMPLETPALSSSYIETNENKYIYIAIKV